MVRSSKMVNNFENIKFKSGLTWRSFLASLYALALFTPAVIWLDLVTTGVSLLGAIQICTILTFAELARYSGNPLSKQEVTIIFLSSSLATSVVFIGMIYRLYFVHSPIAAKFGLTYRIPIWYAPSVFSPTWQLRTFWHFDWLFPLGLYVIMQSLGTIGAYVFASIASEIFIKIEKLPFPMQQIHAQTIITLTERKEETMAILSWGTFIGLIYGIFLYSIPLLSESAGYSIRFIPIPWADFTILLENIMPGASFGIATDIMLAALGLILPFNMVIAMLAGSILRFIFINWFTIQLGITAWSQHYTRGMNFTKILQESTLYLWANPIIGMGFAVGVLPILIRPKLIVDLFRTLISSFKYSKKEIFGESFLSKYILILLITIGTLFILIYHILVPDFPVWALIFWEYPMMFIIMLVTIRILGETGITWQVPYAQQLLILFSGYKGIEGWFLPLNYHPGTTWTSYFKICELTETNRKEWIKTYFLIFPIAVLVELIYVSAFWSIAPIPSAIYPMPAITWPVEAMFQSLWITRPEEYFKPDMIFFSFLIMLAFGLTTNIIKLSIPITGIFVGITTPIPSIFTIFIGAFIGKIIAKYIGQKIYDNIKMILAAGLMLGEGLAVVIGSAGAILLRATWMKPY